jgi:NAD(P)H-flavin reductase
MVDNMYNILKKKRLSQEIVLFEVKAPLIAQKYKPGQFVIIRIHEKGERIPLTVADANINNGSITIAFLKVGKTTKELDLLNEGDYILDVAGPLGHPTEIRSFGKVVCIGGGVGIAAIYPIAKALSHINMVTTIIGARNANLLIFEEEIKNVSNELYITTDDGSKGHHGFVTDILLKLLQEKKQIDYVIAVGPAIMMKVVSNVTKPYGVKTAVSLNSLMVDGTGMCGACRVEVGGKTKFTCVDGPEFDAHEVNFDLLMNRLNTYKEEEKISLQRLDKITD